MHRKEFWAQINKKVRGGTAVYFQIDKMVWALADKEDQDTSRAGEFVVASEAGEVSVEKLSGEPEKGTIIGRVLAYYEWKYHPNELARRLGRKVSS